MLAKDKDYFIFFKLKAFRAVLREYEGACRRHCQLVPEINAFSRYSEFGHSGESSGVVNLAFSTVQRGAINCAILKWRLLCQVGAGKELLYIA